MMPGQLGPTSRVLLWVLRMSTTRTMSFWGMPSVMLSSLQPMSIPSSFNIIRNNQANLGLDGLLNRFRRERWGNKDGAGIG
jgi:hypothetical protein